MQQKNVICVAVVQNQIASKKKKRKNTLCILVGINILDECNFRKKNYQMVCNKLLIKILGNNIKICSCVS
jgi:hypothetical protein